MNGGREKSSRNRFLTKAMKEAKKRQNVLNGSSERINKEAYANDIGKRVKSKCLTKPVKTSKRKNRMSNGSLEGA